MKNTKLLVSALVVVAMAASAQAQTTKSIPFKAPIGAADGSADVILRLYDQAAAGTPLFEETRTVKVSHGMFITLVDVPAAVLGAAPTVWIEAASASDPHAPLARRNPFALKRTANPRIQPNDVFGIPTDSTLCYTCGGEYPIWGGMIPLPYPSTPIERGYDCYGAPQYVSDTTPFLCSR